MTSFFPNALIVCSQSPAGAVVKSQGRQPVVDLSPLRGSPRGRGAPERSQRLTPLALDHRPHSGAQIPVGTDSYRALRKDVKLFRGGRGTEPLPQAVRVGAGSGRRSRALGQNRGGRGTS